MKIKEAYEIMKEFVDAELITDYDDPVWSTEKCEAIHVLLGWVSKRLSTSFPGLLTTSEREVVLTDNISDKISVVGINENGNRVREYIQYEKSSKYTFSLIDNVLTLPTDSEPLAFVVSYMRNVIMDDGFQTN